MSFSTGTPTWTWPDWRKAPVGLRVRSVQTGETATYLGPAKVRNNGARVRWDNRRFGGGVANVVAPARELEPVRIPAWDLIGFDGNAETVADYDLRAKVGRNPVDVRIAGGRARYEGVSYESSTARSDRVRLFRLDTADGLREVSRRVDPDELLELVEVQR